jgi:uncharacterized protein YjbI with pentapeptide repeats
LQNVNLIRANLSGVNLSECIIDSADFRYSDLSFINVNNSILTNYNVGITKTIPKD